MPEGLEPAGKGTLIAPYATSLRMSDLGYRNKAQAGVHVSVNSLGEYVRDLSRLITTPFPEYQAHGVEVDGEWRQLNANWQIETSISFIRPIASRFRANARRRRPRAGVHTRNAFARRRRLRPGRPQSSQLCFLGFAALFRCARFRR